MFESGFPSDYSLAGLVVVFGSTFWILLNIRELALRVVGDFLAWAVSKPAPARTPQVVGLIESQGKLYYRYTEGGALYTLRPSGVTRQAGTGELSLAFTPELAEGNESILQGSTAPVPVQKLPKCMLGVAKHIGDGPGIVAGVAWRHGDTIRTALHVHESCAGYYEFFTTFGSDGGGVVVLSPDDYTVKKFTSPDGQAKATGFDQVVLEGNFKNLFSRLGVSDSKALSRSKTGYIEVYGADATGFHKSVGSLAFTPPAAGRIGIICHNASTFAGFSGSPLLERGSMRILGMHVSGVLGKAPANVAVSASALKKLKPPTGEVLGLDRILNETSKEKENQDDFEEEDYEQEQLEADRKAVLDHFLNERIDHNLFGGTAEMENAEASLTRKGKKLWSDMFDDDSRACQELIRKHKIEFKNETALGDPSDAGADIFMMGTALRPERERTWADRADDVPPRAPSHVVEKKDIPEGKPKELLRAVMQGGPVAAAALIECHKYRVSDMLKHPEFSRYFAPYHAKVLAAQDVPSGGEMFKDAKGRSFFRLYAKYKCHNKKNSKKTQDQVFSAEMRELLKDLDLGDVVDHIVPGNSAENIRNSMEAQASRQNHKELPMDDKQVKLFFKMMDQFTATTAPLFENSFSGDYCKGWEKVLNALDDKSSGWTQKFQAGSKQKWAEDPDLRAQLRLLVSCRIILRACAGPEVQTYTPEQMVQYGLADPKEVFIKGEAHGPAKVKSKRWRLIWVASLIDTVVQGLFSYNQNKRDITDYKENALKKPTTHGLGAGHDDNGIEWLMQVIAQVAGDGKVSTEDAQGWDMCVTRRNLLLDAERRACLASRDADTADIAIASALMYKVDAFVNSAHVLSFDGYLFAVDEYGVTASGVGNTSSQNSFIRAFTALVAGATWALAVGDDLSYGGDIDQEVMSSFGIKTKEGSARTGTATSFELLSHYYEVDAASGRPTARYMNIQKLLSTTLLKHYSGVVIDDQIVGGHLFCLRNTPEALDLYKKVAARMKWNLDVPLECIKEPVDMHL